MYWRRRRAERDAARCDRARGNDKSGKQYLDGRGTEDDFGGDADYVGGELRVAVTGGICGGGCGADGGEGGVGVSGLGKAGIFWMMKTARDTAIAFGAQAAIFGISIFSSVLIARFLGPDGKGVLAILLRVAGVAIAFAQWGIQESLLPFVRENRYSLKSLSGSALALGFVLGSIAAVIVLLAYPFLADSALKGVSFSQLGYIVLSIPVSLTGLFLARFVQLRSTLSYNVGQVLVALVSVFGYVVSFALWQTNVMAGIIGYILAQMVAFCVYASLGRRNKVLALTVDRKIMRELLGSGSSMQIGLVATYLGTQIGVFILNNFSTSAEVGLFTTAIGLVSLLLFFSTAVRIVLQAQMVSTNVNEDLPHLTAKMARHSLVWLLIGGIVLGFLGRSLIVLLYGKAFADAYPMLLCLIPGTIALGIAQVIASYFVAARRLLFTSIAAILVVLVNWLLMVFLGKSLTGISASIVQTISLTLWLIVYVVWFCRTSDLSPSVFVLTAAEFWYYIRLSSQVVRRARRGEFRA
jgi:O-antigen/teichoic acid export membrane protein